MARNPRECVLTAYHRRAAGYRSQLVGDALAGSRLTPEQHAKIQQSLIAFGFLDGEADGEFGSNTRSAIRRLKAQSGDGQGDFLTANQRTELLQGRTLGAAPPSPSPPSTVSPAPTPPPPPQPAPPPRIETARLKEARIFLDDTKKFISQQKSVASITEIAKEAATLQLALNQFDERGAVETKKKLNDLLALIPGFTEFEQQQQTERNREEARRLAEARILAKQNEFFVDTYLQGHLGGSSTQPLLNLRGQIESSIISNMIGEINKANDGVAAYVENNGLKEAYDESARKLAQPEPTPPRPGGTVCDGLTEKSKVLCQGPADEIMLLYNASPTAPRVWKNVRGDVVFQDETASVCFAQPNVELGIARYVDHFLGDRRARKITPVAPPCDLASAGKRIDIIAFRRGDLLQSREDYILVLAKMLEGDTFRPYETIKDYDSEMQKRQALSLQIEADLDNKSREGFGVISVTEMPVACVVPPKQPDRSDGLKELLKRNADVIAATLTAEWQHVDTGTTDLAFLGLQRHQCGYLVGNDKDLRTIMLALRREKMKYSFAPVWWDDKEVDQATFDAHDAARQEILKQRDIERKRQERRRCKNSARKIGRTTRQKRSENCVKRMAPKPVG